MKNAIRNISLLLLILLAHSSCLQNGGNIGDIFGKWVLVRIDGDNIKPPVQNGDIFLSFQKDVVKMQIDRGNHAFSDIFGSFRMDDGFLYLNFPEDNMPPFQETGFDRNCKLQILKLTSKEMELRYQISTDQSLIYYLKKW